MQSELWRRCLERYVIPELPGSWSVAGAVLYREPVQWLLCGAVWSQIGRSRRFTVNAFVQFIASPTIHIGGPHVRDLGLLAGGAWQSPNDVTDAEPVFRLIGQQIKDEAVPLWNEVGDMEGFIADARERTARNARDPYPQEDLVNALIVKGDITGALGVAQSLAATVRAAERLPEWYHAVVARVSATAAVAADRAAVMGMLESNAAQALAALKIKE